MVFERKLKGGLHGYANYEKSYLSWIHLIEQTCPSKEKAYLKLSNIISELLPIFKGWWRRGGTNVLPHSLLPYISFNPLVLLEMRHQITD